MRSAAEIVGAYVSNNPIAASELPALLKSVHAALSSLASPETGDVVTSKPAVPIKKSIHPDYLVCLEDGAHLKMLKRYIRTRYNLTPEEYRAKWNLPRDYPMVAPNYAKRRSEFAKQFGLGKTKKSRVTSHKRR